MRLNFNRQVGLRYGMLIALTVSSAQLAYKLYSGDNILNQHDRAMCDVLTAQISYNMFSLLNTIGVSPTSLCTAIAVSSKIGSQAFHLGSAGFFLGFFNELHNRAELQEEEAPQAQYNAL